MTMVTEDIRAPWLNVIRRLQAATSGNKGHAILTIQIVVDAQGLPVVWSEPNCTKIEPMSRGDEFLRLLAGNS